MYTPVRFTGVYIILLILLKNRLWVLFKYQNFLSENFPYLVIKFSLYLNRYVFVMIKKKKLKCNICYPCYAE